MLDLDSAIEHCYERAEENRKRAELYVAVKATEKKIQECEECANDHEQLAKWLEELKKRRANDRPKGEWIPVSERLPEKSGDYLVRPSDGVLDDYSDFSEVMIMPYEADCEAFGWWSDRYDPVSLGYLDSDFVEFEVIAWQPLPEPYIGGESNDK